MGADFDISRNFKIRACRSGDQSAVEALYRDVFPDEDLVPLLRDLWREDPGVAHSLVGVIQGTVVAQIGCTDCSVLNSTCRVALIGPLAVARDWQRHGIGGSMVKDCLLRLKAKGTTRALVLGDPGYYGRLGFHTETEIATPYPLQTAWRTAWQSIKLDNGHVPCRGILMVPAAWQQPALWSN